MAYRVIVASLAFTLVTAGQVCADDRYASVEPSVSGHDRAIGARKAGKSRAWRKARINRKSQARRAAARTVRKHARGAAQMRARRAALSRPARLIQRSAPAHPVARLLTPAPLPLPQIPSVATPKPLEAPVRAAPVIEMDPEQQAFDATWNRIADQVNPARLLLPAAEAVGSFVAAVDAGTRALVERTVVGLARRFLVETATIGTTMQRQTPEVAIGRLHPVFARRLAAATREARAAGLKNAGCFSAYREPGLRIGGMRDKHASLHAYGLACDMAGIGPPGSDSAKLWHEIAQRHGLYNPYDFMVRRKRQLVHLPAWRHPWEWNHYQVTGVRAILRNDALRRTITANGPVDLEQMWQVGARLIDRPPSAAGRVISLGRSKYKLATVKTSKHKIRHAAVKRGKVSKAKLRAVLRLAARRAHRQRIRRVGHQKRWAAAEIRTYQSRRTHR